MTIRRRGPDKDKTKRRSRSMQGFDKDGRPVPDNPANDIALRRFIHGVPNDEFHAALEALEDPKYEALLAARMDPKWANVSFMNLCRRFNISLAEVDDIWRRHVLHAGMLKMLNAAPEILGGIAEDAKPQIVYCVRCDGIGEVSIDDSGATRVCPACKGKKEVRAPGDKYAREFWGETVGFLGKPAPPQPPPVQINQSFGLGAPLGDVLMMSHKIAQSMLEPAPEVINNDGNEPKAIPEACGDGDHSDGDPGPDRSGGD